MKFKIVLAFLALLGLVGCATVYNPATGEKEFVLIDSRAEMAIGRDVAGIVERKYKLSKDPSYIDRAIEIGQKVAAVSDRKDVSYFFKVIEDKEINAMATPGGYVYVNTGLLKIANDDELACVLAHEVGHIAARHAVKKIQAALGYSILANVAASQIKDARVIKTIDLSFDLIQRGYSREDELLADKLAVKYAYKAGYDPMGMVSFLNKIKDKEKEDPLSAITILRTHPKAQDRIRSVEAEIQTLTTSPHLASPQRVEGLPARRSLGEGGGEGEIGYGPKFCPSCGHYFPENMDYCPKDGTELKYRR